MRNVNTGSKSTGVPEQFETITRLSSVAWNTYIHVALFTNPKKVYLATQSYFFFLNWPFNMQKFKKAHSCAAIILNWSENASWKNCSQKSCFFGTIAVKVLKLFRLCINVYMWPNSYFLYEITKKPSSLLLIWWLIGNSVQYEMITLIHAHRTQGKNK